MKKSITWTATVFIVFFLLFLFPPGSTAQQPQTREKEAAELYKKIYQLYSRKEFNEALETIEKAIDLTGMTHDLLQLKCNILVTLKKTDEALKFLDQQIKENGETEEILAIKYRILFTEGKWNEALATSLKKEKITKIKTPWDCINIMHVYIEMGIKKEALDWLQEAINRGFISYRMLEAQRYALLNTEKRFFDMIENIKRSIGLGLPAKDFSLRLLSGEPYSLSAQRGKVIFILFWATWCEPCKKDLPGIMQLYSGFKDKGFDIIAISLDSNEKRAKDYIEMNKIEWKNCYTGKVWTDPAVVKYGVNSIPSYWVIDKKGVLRSFGLVGDELKKVIETLLAE